MNSEAIDVLVRALSSALRRTSEHARTWDEEFTSVVHLCVLEAVLSTLHDRYPVADAVNGVWNLSQLDLSSFQTVRRLFQADFDASLEYAAGTVSLEVAAAVLDRVSIDVGRHRAQRVSGTIFTPPMLASFLAAEVIGPDTKWPLLREQRVIDPACGSGSLLLATLAEGRKRLEADRPLPNREQLIEWAIGHVIGVDRDRDTALTAACLLGLALGVETEEVLSTGMVRIANSLLDSDDCLDEHSYDKVIMNPPWVKTKTLSEVGYSERLRADPRYPLTTEGGRGDLDLYQFFLEKAFAIAVDGGRIGFIVPGSFLRSARAARLRNLYLTTGHLVRLDEFWNQARIFPIHSMFRFVTGIFEKGAPPSLIDARFRMGSVEDTYKQTPKRLSPSLFVDASNSAARPIPEVITCSGLALLRKISTGQSALGSPNNPWSSLFRFKREFDMTGDKHLFIESGEVDSEEVIHRSLRPVYEGRMVHQFDSTAKTYRGGKGRSAEWAVWLPGREFRPQFYVDDSKIPSGLIGQVNNQRAGFCDITGHANERTILAAIIPAGVVCGNKVPTLQIDDPQLHLLWVAIANSFVVDWYLRRSVTTTINYHYLLGAPFPWVDPTSSVGRRLRTLSNSLTTSRSCDRNDLWRRAQARADIDCQVAAFFGLGTSELNDILDDFPLLDRGQPSPYGGSCTITRDLLVARHSRMLGKIDLRSESRVSEARSAGAIPYIPGELAAKLAAEADNISGPVDRPL